MLRASLKILLINQMKVLKKLIRDLLQISVDLFNKNLKKVYLDQEIDIQIMKKSKTIKKKMKKVIFVLKLKKVINNLKNNQDKMYLT